MKILFIGSVKISASILSELISMKVDLVGVCTMPDAKFNSDFADLTFLAKENKIPVKYIQDINNEDTFNWISKLMPDIIFCFGWSRLIGKQLLSLPRLGVIGYHPTLLPKNRGRHPIIWALVLGLKKTGSTFFFMNEGVDSGDIISQEIIYIKNNDNANTLYLKITKTAIKQIRKFVPKLINNTLKRFPQKDKSFNTWRKRNVDDGKIDWRMSNISIYNLVRGLSHPYAGAHFKYKNQNIIVWKAEIIRNALLNIEPGKVIRVNQKGLVVKAGIGAIRICKTEPDIKIIPGEYL